MSFVTVTFLHLQTWHSSDVWILMAVDCFFSRSSRCPCAVRKPGNPESETKRNITTVKTAMLSWAVRGRKVYPSNVGIGIEACLPLELLLRK